MFPEIITPNTYQVRIASKTFRLREMTAKQCAEYVKSLKSISLKKLPMDSQPEEDVLLQGGNVTSLLMNLLDTENRKFIAENVTLSMAWRIIKIQNRLNGLDEILKKNNTAGYRKNCPRPRPGIPHDTPPNPRHFHTLSNAVLLQPHPKPQPL